MKTYKILRRPLVTEKGTLAQQNSNHYYFEVDTRATKYDVANAVEAIFNVKVTAVRTMNIGGKQKRVGAKTGHTSDWKKAVVTLKEGDKIDFMEGA